MIFWLQTILITLGLANASFLYWQHLQLVKRNRTMVCPLNGHCEQVVESKYGRTLGIKNEILGILYFAGLLILMGYIRWGVYTGTVDSVMEETLRQLAFFGACAGALFSTYLLLIQIFILKQFCTWCLISISLSYALFVLGALHQFLGY